MGEKAANEEKMEKKIEEVKKNWVGIEFGERPYARIESVKILEMNEDQNLILEDNMQHIQTMSRNRFKAFFEKEIENWKNDLNAINDVSISLTEVTNTWMFLESLFIGSDE